MKKTNGKELYNKYYKITISDNMGGNTVTK